MGRAALAVVDRMLNSLWVEYCLFCSLVWLDNEKGRVREWLCPCFMFVMVSELCLVMCSFEEISCSHSSILWMEAVKLEWSASSGLDSQERCLLMLRTLECDVRTEQRYFPLKSPCNEVQRDSKYFRYTPRASSSDHGEMARFWDYTSPNLP